MVDPAVVARDLVDGGGQDGHVGGTDVGHARGGEQAGEEAIVI